MFQLATSGYLKATKHRVLSLAVGEERISVAYFMNPRLDAVFAPIPLPAHIADKADGGQNADPNDPRDAARKYLRQQSFQYMLGRLFFQHKHTMHRRTISHFETPR